MTADGPAGDAARRLVLRPGRAKPLWAGHPWVHADAVASVADGTGDVVRVEDARGAVVGWGWLSPASALRVRMLAWGDAPADEEALLAARVAAAVALRRRLFPDPQRTDAYRLVHGEADGLPGLVVDRFGPVLAAQFATAPVHARRARLAALLLEATGAACLVARPGGKEAIEGIPADAVPFAAGGPTPDAVVAREDGVAFEVSLRRGQKTGHYADQRENRAFVAQIASGARVLDLYAGTGGFSVRALLGGASSAIAVDSSGPALEGARANAAHNRVADRLDAREVDAIEALDGMARAGERFGVVVADPPRFAASRAGLARAVAAYRRLNGKALARVEPGGFLATFSCSGAVTPEAFAEVVRAAARDGRRSVAVLRVFSAGPDHPVALVAPEGRYLTGLLLRVAP